MRKKNTKNELRRRTERNVRQRHLNMLKNEQREETKSENTFE